MDGCPICEVETDQMNYVSIGDIHVCNECYELEVLTCSKCQMTLPSKCSYNYRGSDYSPLCYDIVNDVRHFPGENEDNNGRYIRHYLPDKSLAQTYIGRPITNDEYDEFIRYCRKGIEAQVDWDTVYTCAVGSMGGK